MYRTIQICLLLLCFSSIFSQDWTFFSSDEAGFMVKISGEFIEESQEILTEVGEIKVYSFILRPEDEEALNFLYLINYFDYPADAIDNRNKEMVEEFLSSSILQSAEDLEGEVIYSSDISQEGYPGKISRIQYQNDQAVVKSKMILADNRFYSIQVYSLLEKSLNEEIDVFLNSFRLIQE